MKSKAEKAALALVFGVVMQGSIISAIPGFVPGLTRTLGCGTCEVKLNRGLPTQFTAYMSEEQKKAFKAEMKRRKGAK